MRYDINLITNRIDLMLNKTPKSYSTYKQLKVHREFLIESTDYLKNFNHTIAFIGKVGVGKTTAISKLLNLINNNGQEVLQTGGGRTTICEVEICDSNTTFIKIEPYSNSEIKKYLKEFSLYIENKALEKSSIQNKEAFTLSSEIERTLRNMLKLKIKRFKNNGISKRIDEAIELYKRYNSKDKFYQNLIERIDLPNRNITELFFFGLNDKEWIKNNFKAINNGNNENISLPKKIIINYNKNPIWIQKELTKLQIDKI